MNCYFFKQCVWYRINCCWVWQCVSRMTVATVASTWHVHWNHSSWEQKAAAGSHWQPSALWRFNTRIHHTWAATEQDSYSRSRYWQQDEYRGSWRWPSWIAWDWRRTWCNHCFESLYNFLQNVFHLLWTCIFSFMCMSSIYKWRRYTHFPIYCMHKDDVCDASVDNNNNDIYKTSQL